MRRLYLSLFIYFLSITWACSAPPKTVDFGEEFILEKGEVAHVKGSDISLKLTSFYYHPCPEGAQCVWSGVAVYYELIVDGITYNNSRNRPYHEEPCDVVIKNSDYKSYATVIIYKNKIKETTVSKKVLEKIKKEEREKNLPPLWKVEAPPPSQQPIAAGSCQTDNDCPTTCKHCKRGKQMCMHLTLEKKEEVKCVECGLGSMDCQQGYKCDKKNWQCAAMEKGDCAKDSDCKEACVGCKNKKHFCSNEHCADCFTPSMCKEGYHCADEMCVSGSK